jgi:hypothetical protein
MHYSCEIIMPPRFENQEAGVVGQVLEPFCENPGDHSNAFWDWYVIGGRFTGSHLLDVLDQGQIQKFYDWMNAEKVTVSGVQCGKQTLQPADQQAKVDAKWREMFPGTFEQCPIFDHADGACTREDIMPVRLLNERNKAFRVIIAGRSRDGESHSWDAPIAAWMVEREYWNGVCFQDSTWDGSVLEAIRTYNEKYGDRSWCDRVEDDWITVTVDYHC